MIKRETDTYLDIYPFVDAIDELPSERVSVYKAHNEVSYAGRVYTREKFNQLAEAFRIAFDVQDRDASTRPTTGREG